MPPSYRVSTGASAAASHRWVCGDPRSAAWWSWTTGTSAGRHAMRAINRRRCHRRLAFLRADGRAVLARL